MKDFFQKLLSNSDDVSSKRFISLYALGLLTYVVIRITVFNSIVSDGVVIALSSLVLGSSAITVLSKPKEPIYKEDEKY